MNDAAQKHDLPLWLLAVPVAAWGLHFLASYVLAAVYCAKKSTVDTALSTPIGPLRGWILLFLVVTLAVIGIAAWQAARVRGRSSEHRTGGQKSVVASVLLLLCALSSAATIFITAVPFAFGDCRQ
ncbi:MAG: hypothetical protein WD448_11380 [Woeseia sp.]